jgi:hypothetical protein
MFVLKIKHVLQIKSYWLKNIAVQKKYRVFGMNLSDIFWRLRFGLASVMNKY